MGTRSAGLLFTLAVGIAGGWAGGWIGCASAPPPPTLAQKLKPLLRARLTDPKAATAGLFGETLESPKVLLRHYRRLGYAPHWIGEGGVQPEGLEVLDAALHAGDEGFPAGAFHVQGIQTLLEDLSRRRQLEMEIPPSRFVELELLLTDAFLMMARQFQTGRLRSKSSGYTLYLPRKDLSEGTEVLMKALDSGRLRATLLELLPNAPAYARLREALARYRKLAARGGTKLVPPGPALKPGDRDRRVSLLRQRLLATGELAPPPTQPEESDPWVFDPELKGALERFQESRGLKPDGILGKPTLAELNVPVVRMLKKIEANLERWRWMGRLTPGRSVLVNIPAFELTALEGQNTEFRMPIVAGTLYRPTPIFTGLMDQVVLRPYWYAPKDVILEDLLRKVRKNPDFWTQHGFTLLKQSGSDWKPIDPAEIDWTRFNEKALRGLRVRQEPGPENPLGKVKFLFPNPYSVYLHDTPAKELFKKDKRNLSSGCIRLAKPDVLLKFVTEGNVEVSPSSSSDPTSAETELKLKKPVPVYLTYQTAWVDPSGTLNLRPDVYDQDPILEDLL